MEEQLEAVPHGLREPLDVHAKGRGEERGVQSVSKINCALFGEDTRLCPATFVAAELHSRQGDQRGEIRESPPSSSILNAFRSDLHVQVQR